MDKKRKLRIKNAIDNNVLVEQENAYLDEVLVKQPIIRLIGLVIILLLSIIFNEKVYKLTKVTSNAIFGNEELYGSFIYYFVLVGTILSFLGVVVFGLISNLKGDKTSRKLLKIKMTIYSIYDIGGFVLNCFVYLFFIVTIVVTPCNVSGDSMNNTFYENDRVLVWNLGYSVENGDVIVFDATEYSFSGHETTFYIKRVIASEGDNLRYEEVTQMRGELYVNDEKVGMILYNQYVIITGSEELEFVVPEDKVVVFGDNRVNSYDSRSFGMIDEADVLGKVILRYYPNFGNPSPSIAS